MLTFCCFDFSDLYAFVIGSYAIWTAIAGARYSVDQIRTRRVAALINQIWKWCVIVLKSSALLSIWVMAPFILIQYLNLFFFSNYIYLLILFPDLYYSRANWTAF